MKINYFQLFVFYLVFFLNCSSTTHNILYCQGSSFSFPFSNPIYLRIVCVNTVWHVCGGEKTAVRSWLFSSIVWVNGTELKTPSLVANHFTQRAASTVQALNSLHSQTRARGARCMPSCPIYLVWEVRPKHSTH